jgi:hypothetical protein
MKINSVRLLKQFVSLLPVFALTMAASAPSLAGQWEEGKDVPYVRTPPEVVDAMLKLAEVKSSDFVIDLGCGDDCEKPQSCIFSFGTTISWTKRPLPSATRGFEAQ